MTTLSRPLPLELHEEIHKCLPLPNAIHVLVNISSRAFVDINKPRMLRNVQQLKTSLNEYIGTLVNDEDAAKFEIDGEQFLRINTDLEWKPQLDVLFRYGTWLTSTRQFLIADDNNIIRGMPKNFVEELLLHMTYSRSPQWMLKLVGMEFGRDELPIPTSLKQLLNKKEQYQIGRRFLFESIQLETDNGQILHIFDVEYVEYSHFDELTLYVMNKTDGNNWFRIIFEIDSAKEFILYLGFSKWNMQSFDVANFVIEEWSHYSMNGKEIEENGNKLEAKSDINWDHNLDIILRRGAGFSQFRHFTMKQYVLKWHPDDYVDFLISSISNTKQPEDFLESIDINLEDDRSLTIHKIWKYYHEDIEEGFDKKKFLILSAKTTKSKKGCLKSAFDGPTLSMEYALEFTLANIPTNGAYVFDVDVQFGKEGPKQIAGIKIQKRKNGSDIVELKCEDQIGLGKKTKAENDNDDENGPTHSGKLMKQ